MIFYKQKAVIHIFMSRNKISKDVMCPKKKWSRKHGDYSLSGSIL